MGVNANKETRAHRKCCPPSLPIHIRWDHLGDELRVAFSWDRKFEYDTNGRGDHIFNFWGLLVEIHPRDIMSKAEHQRLWPFWRARWAEHLAREKVKYESSRLQCASGSCVDGHCA